MIAPISSRLSGPRLLSFLVAFITLLILVSAAFYFMDRGFELSDEGYYLYYASHRGVTDYIMHHFGALNYFFTFGSPTLINLRLLRLISFLLGGAFFYITLLRVIQKEAFPDPTLLRYTNFLMLLISCFISYDFLPMTMSYNNWSLVLSMIAISLLLLSYVVKEKRWIYFHSGCYGIVLFAFFLAKFPNTFVFAILFVLAHWRLLRSKLLFNILCLFAGILAGFFLLLHDTAYLRLILDDYYDALFSFNHLKGRSFIEDLGTFATIIRWKYFLLLQFLMISFLLYRKQVGQKARVPLFVFLMLLNFAYALLFVRGNAMNLAYDLATQCLSLLTVIYLFVFLRKPNTNSPSLGYRAIIVALGVMPFLCAAGTNNPFYYTTSHYMVFFIGATILLLSTLGEIPAFYSIMLNTFICFFILIALFYGAIRFPYRQSDLRNKHFAMQLPVAGKVYEDKKHFTDYRAMQIVCNRLNPAKKPLLTTFDNFGLTILTDAQLKIATTVSESEFYLPTTRFLLNKGKLNKNLDLLVVPEQVAKSTAFHELFHSFGINLNENFKCLARYKFLSTEKELYFYVPTANIAHIK